MPTVSIIIPAYNCERYIAETMGSVLAQTWQDIELIVVDDGSTDRTREIVNSFGHSVRLIQQSNAGVCRARNRGIREAKGQFICLMDHDDWWFPDKIERQLREFEDHPEAGVVYSDFILWYPTDDGTRYPAPHSFDPTAFPEGIDVEFSGWIYHKFLLDCWMLTSTAMFRAEVFGRCGGFDESLPYSEDWELWLRIARDYPFIKCIRPMVLYRQHPSQGNRLLRPIDYRTVLLDRASRQWGLCSRDGRCISRSQFARTLAHYQVAFGLSHLRGGNTRTAIRSFWLGWQRNPWCLKYLLYIPAALIGWKPSW